MKFYYSAMFNWDKSLIIAAFKLNRENNIQCTNFVTINAYNMGVNNLIIKIISQWNLPFALKIIIKCMG